MSSIMAIDGGPEKSAWARIVDGVPTTWGWEPNDDVLSRVRQRAADMLVIEHILARGMATERQDVFDTIYWNGKFSEAFGQCVLVSNSEMRGHVCRDMRAKDSDIRRCLIERFGGERVVYGVKCGTCKQAGQVMGLVSCPAGCGGGFVAGKRAGTKKKCERCNATTKVRDYVICPTCSGKRWEVEPSTLAGLTGPGSEHVFSAIGCGLTWLDKHSVIEKSA